MKRRQLIGFCGAAVVAGCAAPPPAKLGMQAAEQLSRIEEYLNGLSSLRADFVQVGPNGAVSHGTAWMSRPGRLQLDYGPPNQASLIVAAGLVTLHDDASDATTSTKLSRTPLAMLLAPKISFTGEVTVTRFEVRPGSIALTMVQTAHPQQGSLTLTFSDDPLVLRGLNLRDARGDTTRLLLSDLRSPGTGAWP